MTVEISLDGRRILSEEDFHLEISKLLDLGEFYGRNLDALFDRLSTDVERPLALVWDRADVSEAHMGSAFAAIVEVLTRVRELDAEWGLKDSFVFELRRGEPEPAEALASRDLKQ